MNTIKELKEKAYELTAELNAIRAQLKQINNNIRKVEAGEDIIDLTKDDTYLQPDSPEEKKLWKIVEHIRINTIKGCESTFSRNAKYFDYKGYDAGATLLYYAEKYIELHNEKYGKPTVEAKLTHIKKFLAMQENTRLKIELANIIAEMKEAVTPKVTITEDDLNKTITKRLTFKD